MIGIGRAACKEFAKRGMNVWMLDIDEDELKAAHDELVVKMKDGKNATSAAAPMMIEYRVVDVSQWSQLKDVAEQVFHNGGGGNSSGGGTCHILMNNAGVGLGGGALETDMATVEKVVAINTYGPIHGCLAFVPKMKEAGEPGIIINTGSKQGITMPPGNLAYNMSKAALKVYTEGLEHELMMERRNNHGKLRAALLIPGWVNTSIAAKTLVAKGGTAEDAFFHEAKPAAGAWMPQQVVDFMISELDKNQDDDGKQRFYIVCPDNDVTRAVDNLRMTWTMQDITENRPPLSRWHPDYKDKFTDYVKRAAKKEP